MAQNKNNQHPTGYTFNLACKETGEVWPHNEQKNQTDPVLELADLSIKKTNNPLYIQTLKNGYVDTKGIKTPQVNV